MLTPHWLVPLCIIICTTLTDILDVTPVTGTGTWSMFTVRLHVTGPLINVMLTPHWLVYGWYSHSVLLMLAVSLITLASITECWSPIMLRWALTVAYSELVLHLTCTDYAHQFFDLHVAVTATDSGSSDLDLSPMFFTCTDLPCTARADFVTDIFDLCTVGLSLIMIDLYTTVVDLMHLVSVWVLHRFVYRFVPVIDCDGYRLGICFLGLHCCWLGPLITRSPVMLVDPTPLLTLTSQYWLDHYIWMVDRGDWCEHGIVMAEVCGL